MSCLGVESRVLSVMSYVSTVFSESAVQSAWRRSGARGHLLTRLASVTRPVLGDGAASGLHDGSDLATWRSCVSGEDIEASTRRDEGQLCAGEHITGSNCGLNMVCWWCDNLAAAKLRGGVQKLTCQGSARCKRQLFGAIASVMGRWELFLCT